MFGRHHHHRGHWRGQADEHHGRHPFGFHGGRDGHLGGGPRGRGGRLGRFFDHGDLRFVVLKLIAEKPSHGYELIKAIETAARLGLQGYLSINFLPNAVYEPATCIQLTLQAARRYGFPTERLIFVTAESEQVRDEAHLTRIFRDYRERGFLTAMDDFGAGYAGLKLLANFHPDLIKLDMALIRDVDRDPARQAIARGVVGIANALGCQPLAEGVETVEEFRYLHGLGIALFQGYLFGRPLLEQLGDVDAALWAKCLDG